jgi:hypothetical protein
MIRIQHLTIAMMTLFVSSMIALAAPTKMELQARFEQRYPEIRAMKAEGRVGETSAGFLEAVKSGDGSTSKLVEEENTDRRALYELIAKEENVEVDVVATRAAQRNFQKAKKGEYLKDSGTWRQK